MSRRIWTLVGAVAMVAAVIVVPTASAAQYSSATLTATQAGPVATIKASLSPNDDPTASVRIVTPVGTKIRTDQAPGTILGPVRAVVKALDLAGADLPLDGQLVVAAPGQVPAATVAACTGQARPTATWVMVLSAAGQTLQVPTYLVGSTGGEAYIQICLPPPDVPAGTPGRATFGAKVYSAQLTINGVFSVASGTWVGLWTPYDAGLGTVDLAATVASPAAIASGVVTLTAKRKGGGAALAGRVTQGGLPRAGATVTIFGGPKPSRLKAIGRVKTGASGAFAFRATAGTFFRVHAGASPGPYPGGCTQVSLPAPCVNPRVNGMAALTKIIRKT